MVKKSITLELSENEARMVRWAVLRAATVTSSSVRSKVLFASLESAYSQISEATIDLEEIPQPKLTYRK